MLLLKKIRELTLEAPSAPGRAKFLSAASGLVVVKSHLYVVPDDELHLGVFRVDGDAPGRLLRILDGDLPGNREERKRAKPDLEALVVLPPFAACVHGALFAVGSGSKRNRREGVILALDEQGLVVGPPRAIDLSGFWGHVKKKIDDLSIEGAVILDDRLVFLQRGNKGKGINALISVELQGILQLLALGDVVGKMPVDIRRYELGSIGDIPLGFTDGAVLPDGRLVFTAVAEDTDNSILDGAFAGAIIGVIARNGRVVRWDALQPDVKVEGINARVAGDRIQTLLVTDADDERVPASLWSAEILEPEPLSRR
jgi:hypothetical protein